jgi:hypothetical protein
VAASHGLLSSVKMFLNLYYKINKSSPFPGSALRLNWKGSAKIRLRYLSRNYFKLIAFILGEKLILKQFFCGKMLSSHNACPNLIDCRTRPVKTSFKGWIRGFLLLKLLNVSRRFLDNTHSSLRKLLKIVQYWVYKLYQYNKNGYY